MVQILERASIAESNRFWEWDQEQRLPFLEAEDDQRITSVFNRIMEEFDLAELMFREVLGGVPAARRPRFTMTHQKNGMIAAKFQQIVFIDVGSRS